MQDVLTMLQSLHRPRLLMRAARIGAEDYRRGAHLPRLLGYGNLPRHTQALLRLMEIEAELNAQRIEDESAYNLLRHIDILIAIVGEARIMQAAQPAA
ncbi:DUF6477 family protein [uncultured Tateyamaria sp.]|uniref:DUF6477 family protein n=1 Tax=Tateyamaria sp. 1078 TaxID=3417464 RepID=UPI002616EBA8|nr:DUF6477 family protein [uncultured Tateyamaria sp.]